MFIFCFGRYEELWEGKSRFLMEVLILIKFLLFVILVILYNVEIEVFGD